MYSCNLQNLRAYSVDTYLYNFMLWIVIDLTYFYFVSQISQLFLKNVLRNFILLFYKSLVINPNACTLQYTVLEILKQKMLNYFQKFTVFRLK